MGVDQMAEAGEMSGAHKGIEAGYQSMKVR